MQLGSFFELYSLDDDYLHQLREKVAIKGIQIKGVFTAHKELGGFLPMTDIWKKWSGKILKNLFTWLLM